MTHIETIKERLKSMIEKREALNEEASGIKIKIKFNEKNIKLAEEEIAEFDTKKNDNTEEKQAVG